MKRTACFTSRWKAFHPRNPEYAVLDRGKWDFYHTETPEKLREQGYATIVVNEALKVAKEKGVDASKSSCSFVRSVIQDQQASSQ